MILSDRKYAMLRVCKKIEARETAVFNSQSGRLSAHSVVLLRKNDDTFVVVDSSLEMPLALPGWLNQTYKLESVEDDDARPADYGLNAVQASFLKPFPVALVADVSKCTDMYYEVVNENWLNKTVDSSMFVVADACT